MKGEKACTNIMNINQLYMVLFENGKWKIDNLSEATKSQIIGVIKLLMILILIPMFCGWLDAGTLSIYLMVVLTIMIVLL